MNFRIKNFRYKVAVGLTFKRLRVETIIDNKPMSQQFLNNDIAVKYNKTWNSGREESLPNTTLENLLIICDYFKISVEDFFKLVGKISDKEINHAINEKVKLKRLLREIK